MKSAKAGSMPVSVTLASQADFAGFRRAARALLARGVPPEEVEWRVDGTAEPSLFAGEPLVEPGQARSTLRVPAELLALCESAALHAEPQRFALLYRLVYRLGREAGLVHDALDDDMTSVRRMAQAVRREMHKMHAFVRFRLLADADGPMHLAWFEPEHHVVEATAPFFARRFANERWSILTPRGSVRWEPGAGGLVFGPAASKGDVPPADAGEALWLTYYRHIFNPARLKLATMAREMPRRYWPNLPEAELIGELAGEATARTGRMVEAPPTAARRGMRRLAPIVAAERVEIDSLPALREAVQGCRACPIGALATQAVCGEGPVGAALMFVGEQPGDQEDLHGRPFVGPAGQLFDRALAEIGIDRSQVYVANAVKHFKHELRGRRRIHKTPAQRELLACAEWLEKEIALVRPRAIVALGATAARSLLGENVAVLSARGQWHRRRDGTPVCVTLHPAALLRSNEAAGGAGYRRWLADLRMALDPPAEPDAAA